MWAVLKISVGDTVKHVQHIEIVRTFFLLKGGGGLLKFSVIGGTENMMGCDLPGRIGTHAATVIYYFWEIFLEFILAKRGVIMNLIETTYTKNNSIIRLKQQTEANNYGMFLPYWRRFESSLSFNVKYFYMYYDFKFSDDTGIQILNHQISIQI